MAITLIVINWTEQGALNNYDLKMTSSLKVMKPEVAF